MINYTKFFLLTILVTVCGVTIAETPIEDNEYVIFYHHDVLGSPIAVSDGKGRVLWYENTGPYGEGLGRNSSDGITSVGNPIVESADNRMGYTGHEKDNTSGLTYMKARHYDSILGRFYSNDPVGFTEANPMMFNRYAYANNNPYANVDPDGKFAILAVPGYAIAKGLLISAGIIGTAAVISNDVVQPQIDRMHSESSQEESLEEEDGQGDGAYDPDETGSYTNTHESGKTYSGKGSRKRSQQSGRRKAREHDDPHIATDWTSSDSDRDAFKDESRRLEEQGGASSSDNYNKLNSPGDRFRDEDEDGD